MFGARSAMAVVPFQVSTGSSMVTWVEAPPLPGSDVFEPDDVEFYLGGHMEGRRGEDYRKPK